MFGKKKCPRCNSKIDKKFDFCPFCGIGFSTSKEDWGMLGENDFESLKTEIKLPVGFNTIFNSLVKNLDKEFQQLDKELGKEIKQQKPKSNIRSGGISISIASIGGNSPKIKIHSFGNTPEFQSEEKEIKKHVKRIEFSEDNLKRLSKLPREEPLTQVKRLSDKLIYEIDVPGVKSIKDVSIIQMENSIEIKAVGKDKAYFKLIPLNFPIINQKLSKGKLVLELESED